MPSPGLSLVGFMPRDQALFHLREACVFPDDSDAALEAEWNQAVAKLGPTPVARAGDPDIQPIAPQHQQYIATLAQLPWIQTFLAHVPGATFSMVEIDKLLAFQYTISTPRSHHHCAGLGQPPTDTELFQLCLPIAQSNESLRVGGTGSAILLRAESLNVRTLNAGTIAPGVIGIQFGISLPLLHVVRYSGKCFLHNGFHRALGARLAGATHVPCLFRDVATAQEAAIVDGATFPEQLLLSTNPPTLEHFTQGRAYDVQLRKIERFIHVSWSEFAIAAE